MRDFSQRWLAGLAGGGVAWVLVIAAVLLSGAQGQAQNGERGQSPNGEQSPAYPAPPKDVARDDYGYGYLTPDERAGRDTWYFWTGGNEKFWTRMAGLPDTHVNLLKYVDSRRHGRRFRDLGAITQPGCRAATAPDQYGLWMDQCDQSPVPTVPGEPTGVMGLRRFPNPDFDPAKWNAAAYLEKPGDMQPPYRIGMACGFCHIGFNPLNPPETPEAPEWANLAAGIGNQYWEEGRLFTINLPKTDFRWHVGDRQAPGTSDTSRFATDHINNPNAINSIFNLAHRPTHLETMNDGSTRRVHHILKDGSDSIGVAGASLRVYVNIGMCSDYWLTLHEPVTGRTRQKPFDMNRARATCPDWVATEARMANAEAFLKTIGPMHLRDARGGAAYLTADAETLRRGQLAFADKCVRCHSSKQPPDHIAADRAKAEAWYRESVLAPDFLDANFLSDDRRYPVSVLGTNIGRAVATNAMQGQVWEQFSSKTYKDQPAVGTLKGLYNPRKPSDPIDLEIKGGGRGYYRTPTLISMWATAPYLHNNALGSYVKDPSVRSRLVSFQDSVEKLLWPERRLGVQSIMVTAVDTELPIPNRSRALKIPAGTPIDLIARVDPREVSSVAQSRLVLNLLSDRSLFDGLVRRNQAPDFILDRGHVFGAELSDDDKRALIEFMKTF